MRGLQLVWKSLLGVGELTTRSDRRIGGPRWADGHVGQLGWWIGRACLVAGEAGWLVGLVGTGPVGLACRRSAGRPIGQVAGVGHLTELLFGDNGCTAGSTKRHW